MQIRTPAHNTAPGYIFLAPKMVVAQAGPMIMDNRGEVVWFKPLNTRGVTDFRVQHYLGKPVLTWWRGHVSNMGVGDGWYVIYDTSYRPVAEVRPGNGLVGDVHEFLITKNNTAVFTVYHRLPVDLSAVGGPKKGTIWDGIVQEVDIKSKRVLFEWHSYPQVGVGESYAPPPAAKAGAKAPPYDYFHINSIAVEPNGNFLVSARNTHTIYEIDRKTKKVLWRLGGKKSDFKMGKGTNFEWQHDARRQANGTITIFDNGAAPPVEKFSRILVLRANPQTKQATLVRAYHHPKKLLAPFEGNAQFLPNGNIFVGWGARAVRQRARPERQAALRRVLRSRQAAGRRRRHVSRLPLRLARPADGPAGRRGRERHRLCKLERCDGSGEVAGARRSGRRAASAGPDRGEERLRDSDPPRQVGRLLLGEGTRPQRAGPRNLRCGRAAALASASWRGGREAGSVPGRAPR